jgi:hypothetical protein
MLLAIPDNTAIIESQNGVKNVKIGNWGCLNPDAKKATRLLKRKLIDGGMAATKAKEAAAIQSWNVGKWTGMNHQGKILMACRAALRTGTEPYIDCVFFPTHI